MNAENKAGRDDKSVDRCPYYEYQKPNWFIKNKGPYALFILGLITIFILTISDAYRGSSINAKNAAELGDFIGGYIGTILTLGSVILLIFTLREQRESSTTEKFETKYFELIKIHRDNVAEIGIGEDFGRKIFVILIREFRALLEIAKEVSGRCHSNFSNEQLFVISYCALFYGVGPNSSRMFKNSLSDFDLTFINEFEKTINNRHRKEFVKKRRGFKFTPFEGHQSRLGHYYRHLYQSIKYVDDKEFDINKKEYIKTIRAQLSTHEQALLFINSLSPQGSPWRDKNCDLLTRYKLVKNVPPKFFDPITEIDMASYFPGDYFEWQRD